MSSKSTSSTKATSINYNSSKGLGSTLSNGNHTSSGNGSSMGLGSGPGTHSQTPLPTRNAPDAWKSGDSPPVLVVSGGGGAFLHATHVPNAAKIEVFGRQYERVVAFPDVKTSRKLARNNIYQFRRLNWRFDVISGVVYILIVISQLPLCGIYGAVTSFAEERGGGYLAYFLALAVQVGRFLADIALNSYLSAAFLIGFSLGLIAMADRSLSKRRRTLLGLIHAAVHTVAAVSLCVASEFCIEVLVENKIFTAVDWESRIGAGRFAYDFISVLDPYSFGLFSTLVKVITIAADVPGWASELRMKACVDPIVKLSNLTRAEHISFLSATVVYFWMIAVPMVSFIFGMYLVICVNYLGIHWDEAFSSLR